MAVTAKGEYACLAMVELARRQADPKPVRLAEIAAAHDIPQRFLVHILLQLKAAGLVSTVRGTSGGYRLAKPAEQITLVDILDVSDRSEAPNEQSKLHGAVGNHLKKIWGRIDQARLAILKEATLASLIPQTQFSDYAI